MQFMLNRRGRRFIPAGAGNTVNNNVYTIHAAVYPRWRGEHLKPRASTLIFCGLSPLARGTPEPVVMECSASRFIPAGAGNTHPPPARGTALPVYPRWRGEHTGSARGNHLACGLSPLARGTQPGCFYFIFRYRFIPAGAGNTVTSPVIRNEISVYPRWRGEHTGRYHHGQTTPGLSPLARGTRL